MIYGGSIVGELGPDATDEELGLLMAGRGKEEVGVRPRPVSEDQNQNTEQSGSFLGRTLTGAVGALLFPVIAIVIAFAIGALIVLATGNNPVAAYVALLQGGRGGTPTP